MDIKLQDVKMQDLKMQSMNMQDKTSHCFTIALVFGPSFSGLAFMGATTAGVRGKSGPPKIWTDPQLHFQSPLPPHPNQTPRQHIDEMFIRFVTKHAYRRVR